MNGRSSRRAERGFTLIEVMLALFILTIGALTLIRLTVAGRQGIAASSKITQATVLAREKLDELERLSPTDALLSAGTHDDGAKNLGPTGSPYTPDGTPTGDFGANDGWFARSWTVTERDVDPTAPGNDFKEIEVQVSWYDGSVKRRRSVSVVGGVGLQ